MLIQSRSSFLRWLKYVGLFCLCLVLTISCARPQTQTPPAASPAAQAGRITIGTTLQPRTLDPADTYELAALNVVYQMSDRLYTYPPGSTEIKPELAADFPKVSSDGLTYTIPIRQGVTFHDGTPFDSKAMEFSLQRFIQNGGKPSFLLADTIDSVKATGDNELTIKLKKPFAAFPSLLAFPGAAAVSPKAYEIGSGKFKPNEFVGTGPYKLAKFGSDSIQLDVFDQYWGTKPTNQGVNIQVFTSAANLYNAFRTGAVDVAHLSLDPDQIRDLEAGSKNGSWQAQIAQGNVVSYMALNTRQKPLDQPQVRQAIAYLIDRPLLKERVLQGQGEALYSLVPSTFDVSQPVFQTAYGDGNAEKAKELLQQAGFSPTNPAVIPVWYPSNSPTRTLAAQALQALAQERSGGLLKFESNAVEAATAFKEISKGVYPAFLLDWYPDFLDADNYVQPFLDCPKGSAEKGCESGGSQTQGSFYYNDRMNQLISQQRQEQNPEARKKIFAEIQEILAKDVPYIPLWQSKDYAFFQKGVSGVQISPTQTLPFVSIQKAANPT